MRLTEGTAMSERLRVLLDQAAADIEPRHGDPAPMIRLRHRRRVRRTRVAMAAATAVAVGATLAVVNLVAPHKDRPDVVASPVPRPMPTALSFDLTGTGLTANGVTLTMPPGWSRFEGAVTNYCDVPDRSILVRRQFGPGPCGPHDQFQVDLVAAPGLQYLGMGNIGPQLVEVTLPGGQPGWIHTDARGGSPADLAKGGLELLVPWSAVHLTFDFGGADLQTALLSLRTPPVAPSRLVLPKGVVVQTYIAGGRVPAIKQEASERVLAMLAALDRPVQPGELPCANAIEMIGGWRAVYPTKVTLFSFRTGGSAPGLGATVALYEADGCSYATSSAGGRVWLPEGFVARLLEAAHDE
jgi:hypothetical protein